MKITSFFCSFAPPFSRDRLRSPNRHGIPVVGKKPAGSLITVSMIFSSKNCSRIFLQRHHENRTPWGTMTTTRPVFRLASFTIWQTKHNLLYSLRWYSAPKRFIHTGPQHAPPHFLSENGGWLRPRQNASADRSQPKRIIECIAPFQPS